MAERLHLLAQRIKKPPPIFVDSSFDFLSLSTYLTKEENELRLSIRRFVETEITPTISPYVESGQFPEYLLPKLKELNPLQYFFKAPYGKGLRMTVLGPLVAELARGDAGVCTFLVVQYGLLGFSIEALGSNEQKAKYIPPIISFDLIGGWALTEDKIGSDASNLETSALKITPDTYKLNGKKRWIGNGNRDLLIVWARNTENKKVQGFIVQNKSHPTTLTSIPIKNKSALRVVQNCDIMLNNVVVKEEAKLPKATDFNRGTNVILKHSRAYVCWVAAGLCMGVYDATIKYVSERNQFGRPISGFQLIQEKIVKMMATTQAVLLMCFRVTELVDTGKATLGQIAMCKAFVTDRTRDVARWGREAMGGNGILHDNYVMKALTDAEAIYTYEGTYDINTLVAARQITGLAAFK